MRRINPKLYDVRNNPTIDCHIENYLIYYRSESHDTSLIDEFNNGANDA